MRKTINIVVFLLVSSTVLWGQRIKTKKYDVANYDQIEVRSSVDIKLAANNEEGVSITCDERLFPAIEIEQIGGELQIGLNWDKLKKTTGSKRDQSVTITNNKMIINGMVFKGGIKAVVYVKQIKKIYTSSSGDVEWEGSLPTNELYLSASSSGDITWTGLLKVDNLHIDCSSSGDVEGDFEGNNAFVDLSSCGDYKGVMNVKSLNVDISSSADFEVNVNATKAVFDLSSSGDAKVKGTIGSLFVEASSSSDFYGKKIIYKYAEVKTSSFANIYLSKSGQVLDKTPKRTGVFVE